MKPKISVIIASYNHQDYIAATLESLEKQTFQDFEIIIVDDGSTDKTVEVAKKITSRAKIYTQQNRGTAAARNRGTSLASGQYICFIDSDDIILPERFAAQSAVLDSNPQIGLTFSDALIIDSKGRQIGRFNQIYPVINGDTAKSLITNYCFMPLITVMVRTDILEKTGSFEKPNSTSDYIKWIEVSILSEVHYDTRPLGYWRRHSQSTSKTINKEKSYAMTRIALRKVLCKYPQLKADFGKKIMRRFAKTYFLTGFWLAAQGDTERAKKYYCKALKTFPFSFANWCGLAIIAFTPSQMVVKLHQYILSKKLPW